MAVVKEMSLFKCVDHDFEIQNCLTFTKQIQMSILSWVKTPNVLTNLNELHFPRLDGWVGGHGDNETEIESKCRCAAHLPKYQRLKLGSFNLRKDLRLQNTQRLIICFDEEGERERS